MGGAGLFGDVGEECVDDGGRGEGEDVNGTVEERGEELFAFVAGVGGWCPPVGVTVVTSAPARVSRARAVRSSCPWSWTAMRVPVRGCSASWVARVMRRSSGETPQSSNPRARTAPRALGPRT